MARVTVVSDVRRRRDWSDEERMEILREAFAPGAIVAGIARRYDISRGMIYIWRRKAIMQAQSAFAPAVIEDAVALETLRPGCGAISGDRAGAGGRRAASYFGVGTASPGGRSVEGIAMIPSGA